MLLLLLPLMEITLERGAYLGEIKSKMRRCGRGLGNGDDYGQKKKVEVCVCVCVCAHKCVSAAI